MNSHQIDMTTDYCIEIQYEKNSPSPSRVFKAMTELIEAFSEIDRALVESIDSNIEPVLVLEDIQSGSVRTWLRAVLSAVDDGALKELDWKQQVGKYLVQAKYFIINYLDKKTTISNINEIEPLQAELLILAQNTNVRWLPFYKKPETKALLDNIQKLSSGMSELSTGDTAKYITKDNTAPFNLTFNFTPEQLSDLLVLETKISQSEMIVKAKKPDFLGESMWDYKFGDQPISAKITDKEWLSDFQAGKKPVQPQDALRVMMEITHYYDADATLTDTQYKVIKVFDVIHANKGHQIGLDNESH